MSTDYVLIESDNMEVSVIEQSCKFNLMIAQGILKGDLFKNVEEIELQLTDEHLVTVALHLLSIASYQGNERAELILKEISIVPNTNPIKV